MQQAVRASLERKYCTYWRLVYLAIDIGIDCNLREGIYSCGCHLSHMVIKWPIDEWNTAMYVVFAPPLSLLSNQTWTRWVLCTQQQATVYMSGQLYTSYADRVWKSQAFATMRLLQPTDPRIFIFSLGTEKCYFIGWLSLRRDGCVVSIAQPPLGLVILGES